MCQCRQHFVMMFLSSLSDPPPPEGKLFRAESGLFVLFVQCLACKQYLKGIFRATISLHVPALRNVLKEKYACFICRKISFETYQSVFYKCNPQCLHFSSPKSRSHTALTLLHSHGGPPGIRFPWVWETVHSEANQPWELGMVGWDELFSEWLFQSPGDLTMQI